MTDFESDDSLPPASDDEPGTLARVRSLARRGRNHLVKRARRGLDAVGDRLLDRLREVFSSREHVERLQEILARIASWSLQRGFETDPNAGLLFEFVDWLEQRHGRRRVAAVLMRSRLLTDPAFLEAFAHLSRAYSPWPTDGTADWDQEDVDRFKHRAGDRLLDLLVELASLETDTTPPERSAEQVEYFEEAELPARFHRLAAMTRGRQLLERSTGSESFEWARRLADRLPGSSQSSRNLRRFVPGTDDETLHFLVFSTSFFFQSYLVRNLIESLPGMADELDRELRDDDPIDID